MGQIQKGAAATTATTLERLDKDSDNIIKNEITNQ